jgi:two-component system sensor histidine kinase KdpD
MSPSIAQTGQVGGQPVVFRLRTEALSHRRRLVGHALAAAAPLVLLLALVPLRSSLGLAGDVSAYLVVVVGAALVGGIGPALVAAVWCGLLLNYFFTAPLHTLTISDPDNVVAVAAFVVVAVMVSWVVDVAARRADAAAAAAEIEAADRMRTALLAAVGHDLRTPLATTKAVVSGMRDTDVTLSDQDRAELLATADSALDRLTGLVDNLLDLSRLQAGALPVRLRPTVLEDVVSRALDDLGVTSRLVLLEVPDDLPAVVADSGLLERVLVNLLTNAQRFSPEGRPPSIIAFADTGAVLVQVVDHGPGIALADRGRVFLPFQRLGDTDAGSGIGLGLALARGLTEAMGGTLGPSDTPGGGLTMTVRLPAEVTP